MSLLVVFLGSMLAAGTAGLYITALSEKRNP